MPAGLAVLCVLATAHVVLLGSWVVEDAAISFAYARNWADGWGLVPYVGGERVEGYSNPTWVLLLAVAERLGVGSFWAAKAMSIGLVVATVPVVYRLGARAAPAYPKTAGGVAATVFAVNTQVAIFGAAGLENPLFSFLLAAGLLQADREAERQGRPWSALIFLALALTRPEGVLYAAVAGVLALAVTLRERRSLRPIGEWLALFFVPFVAYHAARYAYFAWPFPMTYYAKVRTGPGAMVVWSSRGWVYLRDYVADLHQGAVLPLYVIGRLAPGRDPRRWGLVATACAIGVVLWLLPAGEGREVARAVTWMVLGAALLLPGFGERTSHVRAACFGVGLVSAVFALQAQGDWMGGFRWLSYAVAPGAVLVGAAVSDLLEVAPARGRALVAAAATAGTALLAFGNVRYTLDFKANPEISPYNVRHRIAATKDRFDRLHLDERPLVMTVDMGAFMYWSGWELIDAVGLTDVAFAMMWDQRSLVTEDYVFGSRRPHALVVPHAMGDQIRRTPGFDDVYVDVSKEFSVRRDLLFDPVWPWADGRTTFDGGVELAGLHVGSPEVARGGSLFVEVGLVNVDATRFTSRLVLSDDTGAAVASWPIAPAYGWLPPERWRPEETFHGRYVVALPPSLPEGRYRLDVRLSAEGEVLEPILVDGGDRTREIAVVSDEAVLAAAQRQRALAATAAAEGRCEDAERAWLDARNHRPDDEAFAAGLDSGVHRELAACWVARADTAPDDALAALVRARSHDREAPGLEERLQALADARYAAGLALREARRWVQACRAFEEAVTLDPYRPWARRYAEEAREKRLVRAERVKERGGAKAKGGKAR